MDFLVYTVNDFDCNVKPVSWSASPSHVQPVSALFSHTQLWSASPCYGQPVTQAYLAMSYFLQPCYALCSAMTTYVKPCQSCQAIQQYPGSFSQPCSACPSHVHPGPALVSQHQPLSASPSQK